MVDMKLNFRFSLRGPDRVSDALAIVLSQKGAWEFKTLFDLVHANLLSKDYARGGDEMLRLRAHEKLQNFLTAGVVTKSGKEYKGVPKALDAWVKTSAEFNARFASGTHNYPAHKASGSGMPKAAKAQLPIRKCKRRLKSAAGGTEWCGGRKVRHLQINHGGCSLICSNGPRYAAEF